VQVSARWALTGELIDHITVRAEDSIKTLRTSIEQISKVRCSIQLLNGCEPLDEGSTLASSGLTAGTVIDVVRYEDEEQCARRLTRELGEAMQTSEIVGVLDGISDFLCGAKGETARLKRHKIVVDSGMMPAVACTLRDHLSDSEVQEVGWHMLAEVTRHGRIDINPVLRQNRLAPLVQKAIQVHPQERKLRKAASATLSNLYQGLWSDIA